MESDCGTSEIASSRAVIDDHLAHDIMEQAEKSFQGLHWAELLYKRNVVFLLAAFWVL